MRNFRLHIIVICALIFAIVNVIPSQGFAQEDQTHSDDFPRMIKHLFSSKGFYKLLYVSTFNFATGVGTALYNGQIATIFNEPEQWCMKETELFEFSNYAYKYTQNLGSIAQIAVGDMDGINGDWGFAIFLGYLGVEIGTLTPCQGELPPPLRTLLILTASPIINSFMSFLGFYFHAF